MTSSEAGKTAVVVNDDATQRQLLGGLLGKAGLQVSQFAGAEAALAAMQAAGPPDLIVTDVYMPGLDGWAFCRLLRSAEYHAFNAVPILVVSATFMGEEPARIAADLGANVYLPAPVDGKMFLEQVRALLDGQRPRIAPRVLIVDDDYELAGLLEKIFRNEGYEVSLAFTTAEAETLFAESPYEVVLIDYCLPDGNGDRLLEPFRAQRPGCACIMYTGHPSANLSLEWLKRGAAACAAKPFAPAYLLELSARARRERALLRSEHLLEQRTRELRQREADYRLLFREMMNGFALHEIICDPSGTPVDYRFLDVNPAFERLTGLQAATIVGRTVTEVLPKIEPEWIEIYGRVALTGQAAFFQMYSGALGKHFEVTAFRPDTNRFACIFSDITARQQAEAESKRLTMAIEQAGDVIVITNPDGNIEYVNPAFTAVTGYTRAEVMGHNPRLLKSGEQDNAFYRELWTTITSGRAWQGRFINKRKDGALYTEEATISPVRDSKGWIAHYVAVKRDITEHMRLAAQLQQAQKMQAIGRLAGGVAHDFNNMLQAILGTAEMAQADLDPASPLHADLEAISRIGRRSADLTRQLLAFARQQTIAPVALDLNEAVGGMLKMLRRLIGEHIQLGWQPRTDLWPVIMDPSQLDQIMANLCVNARDAVGADGEIVIATENVTVGAEDAARGADLKAGEYVRLTVRDNGCGMNQKTRAHLFEPFFTTKKLGEGTGLGLATVYGIVQQNQGHIIVESEPEQGSTFIIYWPRHQQKPATQLAPAPQPSACGGWETILVVEDERAVLTICQRCLTDFGYTVLTAESPEQALRLVQEHSGVIDLLLSDMVMPGMNGLALRERLVALRPGLRTLFMTGYTAQDFNADPAAADNIPILLKPFSKQALGDKVRELLDTP